MACIRARIVAYRVLAVKSEGRKSLEKHRRRCEDNIKWILEKWDGGGMDGIDLSQCRHRWWALVNAVTSLEVP